MGLRGKKTKWGLKEGGLGPASVSFPLVMGFGLSSCLSLDDDGGGDKLEGGGESHGSSEGAGEGPID